jgi:hypothetical protein
MRYVRITCSPVHSAEHSNILIDAILDEADHILGKHALFGLWGDPNQIEADFFPLILTRDDMIVFDIEYANEDRKFRFNLRDVKIKVGQLLTYVQTKSPFNQTDYRISNIVELPETA